MHTINSAQSQITSSATKSRLFTRMGMWYFQTVEGKEVGPFRYRNEAESLLSRFIHDRHEQGLAAITSGQSSLDRILSSARR